LQGEQDLAGQCLKGDEAAWETLVARYHRKVWNVAYQFTGRVEEADELTQEIFLHVTGALKSFEPGGNLAAWLLRVARNYAIDNYRRRRRELAHTATFEDQHEVVQRTKSPSRMSNPDTALVQKELATWIRSALDRLPKELGQAVLLRDLQEMSYDDMVHALDVPLGTVKSRINRGRLELARQLKRRRSEWSSRLDDGERQ
jgi:RNA polymerase sigma-70 factor (ECF subfamily)